MSIRNLITTQDGPVALTTLCATSIGLMGLASANVALAMQGFDLTPARWVATAFGYAAGSYLLYLGHCRLLKPQPPPAQKRRRKS